MLLKFVFLFCIFVSCFVYSVFLYRSVFCFSFCTHSCLYTAVCILFLYKSTDRCYRWKLNCISYHIVSYVMSYRIPYVISYHIISCHILSYRIIYHIYHHIKYHIISYHIIYHITYLIISYHIIPRIIYHITYHISHVSSYHLPYHIIPHITYHIILYHIIYHTTYNITYHIISYQTSYSHPVAASCNAVQCRQWRLDARLFDVPSSPNFVPSWTFRSCFFRQSTWPTRWLPPLSTYCGAHPQLTLSSPSAVSHFSFRALWNETASIMCSICRYKIPVVH
jgi:hypothetical protein